MKILTVISGILLTATGAFCFAFYTNLFSGLAFIIGLAMLISGLCSLLSYIISGRKNRLPDTVLVEGIVTALLGFAVLNNQVIDAMLIMFFGTWLTLAGVSRVSQSLAISRYSPKDWIKVMPLAACAAILGALMLMQTIVMDINSLFLIGSAFIVNGLSQLIYAMYMERKVPTEKELQAIERAEAKKIAAEAERKERKEARVQAHKQGGEKRREERHAEKKNAMEKRAQLLADRSKERAKRDADALENTRPLTPEDMAAIQAAAVEAGLVDEEELEAMNSAPENTEEFKELEIPAHSEAVQEETPIENPEEEETEIIVITEEAPETEAEVTEAETTGAEAAEEYSEEENIEEEEFFEEYFREEEIPEEEEYEEEILTKPVWNRPTDIPTIDLSAIKETEPEPEEAVEDTPVIAPLELKAINLEKIEEGIESVEFESVELPEPELQAEGGEAEKRDEIIEDLGLQKDMKKDDPFKKFKALDLDELFGDDYVPLREKDPKEATRFTQTLNIDWEAINGKK